MNATNRSCLLCRRMGTVCRRLLLHSEHLLSTDSQANTTRVRYASRRGDWLLSVGADYVSDTGDYVLYTELDMDNIASAIG